MAGKITKKIGEILIEDGLLTPAQLEEALAEQKKQGGLLGQVLINKKFVDEDHLTSALSKQFHIPYLPLRDYSINPDMASVLKAEFCHENLLVGFDGNAKRICIAVSDPLNVNAVEQVKAMTQKTPHVFISKISEIRNALYFLYHEKA